MNQEVYSVDVFNNQTTYYFESVGPRGIIAKVIQFAPINRNDLLEFGMAEVYNLGFGDLDTDSIKIDDLADSRNGDKDKVLTTVARVTLRFLDAYPEATVYATGSTPSRTRQYQMGLSRFYDEIIDAYALYGLTNGRWHLFERNRNYQAFVIHRR
ncbi:hypothetical protein GO730_31795 [Spirosoma sp. HMF3257]|uniref:Uncharacterized protein n=1 Tax=Spirosoma telluris TaxID=2183553 RepID=A0A327NQD9_9BACT|nr:hypothetical protein [Spirosoma telluris]RAI77580.1 hypothetical protein HMF3257_31685 [Spirosoma telluris]